jgi:hypothetical protein
MGSTTNRRRLSNHVSSTCGGGRLKGMATRYPGTARRRPSRSISSDFRPAAITAFVKITQQCFDNFVRRFGRYPSSDEPLLFDPQAKRPACASRREMRSQVIAAAKAAGVDAGPMLEYLGLVPQRTESSDPRES